MRTELKKLVGERRIYTARFVRFGSTPDLAGHATALLIDVQFERQVVADHIWIRPAEALRLLAPSKGAVISFTAEVGFYSKRVLADNQRSKVRTNEYALVNVEDFRILFKKPLKD
jgi:hypothetical protein